MKKTILPVLLSLTALLGGCGESAAPQGSADASADLPETVALETLAVELPRALDTAAARQAMERLPALMEPLGVEIGTVSLTFGTSYAATAAALEQGGVDLAFLPAAEFTEFCETAVPLLGDAGTDGSAGTSALLCAGPSAYGTRLADLRTRRSLTWGELNNARWGVLNGDALAGYQCLELWLEDTYEGSGVADLTDVTVYNSWEDLLRAAAGEEIDLFPLDRAQQTAFAELWTMDPTRTADSGAHGFGREQDIAAEVRTLDETEQLYDFVAAVTPGKAELQTEQFRTALADALAQAFDGPAESKAAIGAAQYLPIRPEDLNPLRRLLFGT